MCAAGREVWSRSGWRSGAAYLNRIPDREAPRHWPSVRQQICAHTTTVSIRDKQEREGLMSWARRAQLRLQGSVSEEGGEEDGQAAL